MIPPQELGKKTFTRAVRGYEPSEVDEYLEFLNEKYSEIYNQCEIYHKKLKIVGQKIEEIQEREEEIQSKEETIGKAMTSSQKIHDKRIEEAQQRAENIVSQAEETAEKILADARERAQKALAAVDEKTKKQIKSASNKSENLYLAARTRCASLLKDFKREIGNQKERMSELRIAADEFNIELSALYKSQFEAIQNVAVYTPDVDFEKLTETRLFNMIMEEIREDMSEIEAKNDDADYEFKKELAILRDFDFADEHINEYKAGISRYTLEKDETGDDMGDMDDTDTIASEAESAENKPDIEKPGDERDDDVKVFAGGAGAGTPRVYEAGAGSADTRGGAADTAEEESISTYDSDDYKSDDYSDDYKVENPARAGYPNSVFENGADDDDIEEENAGGILGFFKGFGKKKKKNIDSDDVDDIYSKLDDDDDDDDEVMNIFDGFGDDDDEDEENEK